MNNPGYTSARVLARVADEDNQKGWLDFAMTHSRRELEKEVKLARQEAADKVEALLEIMEPQTKRSARADIAPAPKPPVQIHIHQCPDCAKATVQTSKGELDISEAELDRAQCDCRISRPGERNTMSISPAVRRRVLADARHRCQRPGCEHTVFLEVHHIVPRSSGGTNELANLQVLCSACHKLLHDRKLGDTGFMVKSPKAAYRWGNPEALPQLCPATEQDRATAPTSTTYTSAISGRL